MYQAHTSFCDVRCGLWILMLSIIIPKYLIVRTCSSILFKYIFIALGSFLFLLDTSMTFDFSSLNLILFLFAQAIILLSTRSSSFRPRLLSHLSRPTSDRRQRSLPLFLPLIRASGGNWTVCSKIPARSSTLVGILCLLPSLIECCLLTGLQCAGWSSF